jgi:arylsulfatase A-like enzyme
MRIKPLLNRIGGVAAGRRRPWKLSDAASLASVAFAVLGAGYTLLYAVMPGSARHSEDIGKVLKAALAARELLLLAVVVLLAAAGWSAIISSRSRVARGFGRCLFVALTAVALAVYGAAWYALASLGKFVGREGLHMYLINPRQILEHVAQMDPAALLAFPAALLATVVVVVWIIPALHRRLACVRRHGAAAYLLQVLACFLVSERLHAREAVMADRSLAHAVGVEGDAGEFLQSLLDDRTGPLNHWLAEARRSWRRPLPHVRPAELAFRYPRQITLEEYAAGVNPATFRRRSVLLILVESLRPDQLESFGGVRSVMPTVDRLAFAGRTYTRHYTQASHSNYADICPLSSHYPLRAPVYASYPENPPYPRVLIYDILQALGYRTAIISSQNENWGRMLNYLRTPGLDYLLHAENYAGPTYVPSGGSDGGFEQFVALGKRAGKIDDRLTAEEVVRWLQIAPQQPFFLYTNLQNSHVPYEIPASFPRKFSPPVLDFVIRFGSYPHDRVAQVKDVYADSLRYVDRQIERIVAALEASGRLRDTLIVISGDTGQAFYEHGFASHASAIYDEVMRVPLILSGGGVEPGRDERLSEHIDVPPTILDALGLPSHPSFQGRSLLEKRPLPQRSVYLLAQTPLAHQYGVVRGRHKLIYDYRAGTVRLFDLQADPGEITDLAKSLLEVAEDLLGRVLAWREHQLGYYADHSLMATSYPPRLPLDE